MKKFLKDESGVQELPIEVFDNLFKSSKDMLPEKKKASNKFIVIKFGKTDEGIEWQVAYQAVFAQGNNHYIIFLFNKEGVLIELVTCKSVHPYPIVSEKIHGLDFLDWLEIQGTIVNSLKERNFKFEVDFDPKDKLVYITKESPEEIEKLFEKNESYQIIAIKAEVYLEKIKEYQNSKNLIITPEQANAENAKKIII